MRSFTENDKYSYVYITYNLILEDDQEYPCVGTYMVGKQDKTYYIMAPSQITDDMKNSGGLQHMFQFMKTDAYRRIPKHMKHLSRRIRDMKQKFQEKAGV